MNDTNQYIPYLFSSFKISKIMITKSKRAPPIKETLCCLIEFKDIIYLPHIQLLSFLAKEVLMHTLHSTLILEE